MFLNVWTILYNCDVYPDAIIVMLARNWVKMLHSAKIFS